MKPVILITYDECAKLEKLLGDATSYCSVPSTTNPNVFFSGLWFKSHILCPFEGIEPKLLGKPVQEVEE
jgi:hypothetical protein